MFDMADTAFSYGRGLIVLLITSGVFQDERKYSGCDLKCRYCVFTLWGSDYAKVLPNSIFTAMSSFISIFDIVILMITNRFI